MMPWAFVFAADMAAGLAREAKNLRRNEMLGNRMVGLIRCGLICLLRKDAGLYRLNNSRLYGVSKICNQCNEIAR